MRRVLITFLILVTCLTQVSFASTDYYEYDSSNIRIPLSDEEWSVFTAEDRSYWSENLDADAFDSVYSIFDSNDNIKFVAIDKEGTCYWTFMPFGGRSQPDEFSSYSDSEWKEFRLSYLSDEEVEEVFGDYVDSPGFEAEFDSIDSFNYQKYLMIAGRVTNNGQSLPLFSYLTIVNGYTYTFNLYLLTEEKVAATSAITKMSDVLWAVEYKSSDEATSEDEAQEIVNDESSDRSYSLMTALIAVLIAVVAISLVRLLISKKKKPEITNNQISEKQDQISVSLTEEQPIQSREDLSSNTDYENLKALKNLYEDGVITEEEYAAKKKQILGL